MLRGEEPSFTHEQKEIFRCKEFAGSRAEKACGCCGSNKVSKITNEAQETRMSFATRAVKTEKQSG